MLWSNSPHYVTRKAHYCQSLPFLAVLCYNHPMVLKRALRGRRDFVGVKLGQKQNYCIMVQYHEKGWRSGHFSFHAKAGKLVRKKAAKPIFYATVLKCRERNWLWWNAHEMHQMCVGWGSREAKVASLASVPPWLPIQKRSKSWFKVERNWAIVFHTPVKHKTLRCFHFSSQKKTWFLLQRLSWAKPIKSASNLFPLKLVFIKYFFSHFQYKSFVAAFLLNERIGERLAATLTE